MYTGLVLVQTYRSWSSVRLNIQLTDHPASWQLAWSLLFTYAYLSHTIFLCENPQESSNTGFSEHQKKKKILSPGRYINTWIFDWESRDRKLEIFISLHVNGDQPCWLKSSSLYVQSLLAFGRLRSSNTCEVFWDPPASSSEFIYKCKGKASFKNTSTS